MTKEQINIIENVLSELYALEDVLIGETGYKLTKKEWLKTIKRLQSQLENLL